MENTGVTNTDAQATTETAPQAVSEATAAVPSFTIRADSLFGIRSMIAIRNLALQMLPRDEQRVIQTKLRAFDLYEEANRTK